MIVEVTASIKGFEVANCILAQAINVLLESEKQRENLGLTLTDVKDAARFRESMLVAFKKSHP